MAKIIPSKILASNGGSPANEMYLHGKAKGGRSFLAISQHSGGYGASELFDGHSCLCFPNNTSNIPIEVTENEANMYYLKKEFLVELNRFNSLDLRELSKKIKKEIHLDAAKKIANEIKKN